MSWQFSKTEKAVRIAAYDEQEARRLAAIALYNGRPAEPGGKYEKIKPPPSPWDNDTVTSCEIYREGTYDAHHIEADDGEKWPRNP